MGLPEILIAFSTAGLTAIQRSSRGVVALILKDSTKLTFDTKIYTSITEIVAADWTAGNKDYIEKAFLGTPSKIIVERIASDALDYNAALTRLANKKFNYLAIPGILVGDVAAIATWIKTQRDANKKTFKAVLPSNTGDHEGIINFTTADIAVGAKTYTTAEYCARIAGILAGLPLTRSSTFYALAEVTSITETTTPDIDIDAGKLILINDGAKIKIGRGINSLTTTTADKGEDFKKIKIVEGIDLVRDDIRDTFYDGYVGKIVNSYDHKVLFLAAVNAYLTQLVNDSVLDPAGVNTATIDTEAHRTYITGKGTDPATLTDQEIKEYNTGSTVFAAAQAKFVDAMEDLKFNISM